MPVAYVVGPTGHDTCPSLEQALGIDDSDPGGQALSEPKVDANDPLPAARSFDPTPSGWMVRWIWLLDKLLDSVQDHQYYTLLIRTPPESESEDGIAEDGIAEDGILPTPPWGVSPPQERRSRFIGPPPPPPPPPRRCCCSCCLAGECVD